MFLIRIEHQNRVRNYTADSQYDATELFFALTKTFGFVQVWKGDKLISEYKN
jgi:hypothetical protein